jgi:hypothetical protein
MSAEPTAALNEDVVFIDLLRVPPALHEDGQSRLLNAVGM